MSKKVLVWLLSVALSVVFVSLVGVQYFYYTRIIAMSQDQTNQMAHKVLRDVAKDIETRELVRYLNYELNTNSETNNTLVEALKSLRGERFGKHVQLRRLGNRGEIGQGVGFFDSLAVSDQIVRAVIDDHTRLEEYVLRHLYRLYSYDSIPQLVNPRLLRESVRMSLKEHGIEEPFQISLCNVDGKELFRYTDPYMSLDENQMGAPLIQRLFVNQDLPNKLTPFLRLRLDFGNTLENMWSIVWPGLIVTLIVLMLGGYALFLMMRQLSFQEMKTDFINNMTHELKTPVSSILLSVEQMQRLPAGANAGAEDQAKRRRYLTIVEDEAQRLRMLIDKVLQLALYEKDRKEKLMNQVEFSVDEIIFKAAKIFSVHAAKYNGELILEHNADNTWIVGSETHMTNVLYNLLENAVKYREDSRPLQLIIRTYNDVNDDLVIIIEDNGRGVPEDDLKHIFKRFYRVHTGLQHNVKGYGLGLAYVQSVIRQSGGRITAKSKAEGGLTMMIVLPTSSPLGTD